MDFTFTVPSGIPPINFGSTTSTTTSDATSPKQPTSSTTTTSAIDSLDEHISLKRIHGVGDTKQWRRRLIHQIEDRIKDRREAIHNAQRRGFVGATGSSGSGNESGVGSRAVSGGVGDEFSRAALPGSQGEEAVGLSEALVLRGDSYISEEEERVSTSDEKKSQTSFMSFVVVIHLLPIFPRLNSLFYTTLFISFSRHRVH